jgi:hypothetical protein
VTQLKVDGHDVLLVRSNEISARLHVSILEKTDVYDKVNVMLTDVYRDVAAVLYVMRDKIGTLIVARCDEWDAIRLELEFCPSALYVIDDRTIDAVKFAQYN